VKPPAKSEASQQSGSPVVKEKKINNNTCHVAKRGMAKSGLAPGLVMHLRNEPLFGLSCANHNQVYYSVPLYRIYGPRKTIPF
jgi:hypothetical protein